MKKEPRQKVHLWMNKVAGGKVYLYADPFLIAEFAHESWAKRALKLLQQPILEEVADAVADGIAETIEAKISQSETMKVDVIVEVSELAWPMDPQEQRAHLLKVAALCVRAIAQGDREAQVVNQPAQKPGGDR